MAEKIVKICDEGRINLREAVRRDWVCDVPVGVTFEQCMMPEFWSHKSKEFNPYDHIELRAEDGSWTADLMVLGCDRNWARVHLRHKYELTTADVSRSQAARHEVKYNGPHLKWCVIRLSDQQPVKEKCATREEATLWSNEHERTTSAVI